MCGFGDSWIKDNRPDEDAEQVDAAPPKDALIIFVKNPEKGKVKTRLAKTIGDDKALEAYLMMLAHTRDVALQVNAARFLFYTQFVDEQDDWPGDKFRKSVQVEADLGGKMQDAFQKAFAAGMDRVVIVGSDCLDLRPRHLQQAFQALESNDYVIGPAEDGGYYLLGMRNFHPAVFENKQWSTETVLPDTLADIEAQGASVHLLETLSDVDYEEDLKQALARRSVEN